MGENGGDRLHNGGDWAEKGGELTGRIGVGGCRRLLQNSIILYRRLGVSKQMSHIATISHKMSRKTKAPTGKPITSG
jgi:hypothetical protein